MIRGSTAGVGGAAAETVVRSQPVPVRFVGADGFTPTGSVDLRFDHVGISATGMAASAREVTGA